MGDRILQLFFQIHYLTGEASLIVVFYQTLISTAIILLTAEFLPKVFFQLYANTFIKILQYQLLFLLFFYPITFLLLNLQMYILKDFLKLKQISSTFIF